YEQFMNANAVEYVMPPWNQQELQICSQITDTSDEEADERYHEFGGNARLVFSKTPLPDIDGIFGKLSIKDTVRFMTAPDMQDERQFHSILHMFPKHEHKRPYRGVH
ncbi:unnamed protein product, partial [Aphanomyces euteiches]